MNLRRHLLEGFLEGRPMVVDPGALAPQPNQAQFQSICI
jgi:hypothetical protein